MSNDVGRPTVITAKVVSLLVASFHSGLTVREACWQSGISHEAYYNRLRSDEQFADTMARAQSDITMTAKALLAKEIRSGNISAARWWLEHKKPQEEAEIEPESSEWTDEEEAKWKETLDRIIETEVQLRMDRERGYVAND